jgi:hypothetical protein
VLVLVLAIAEPQGIGAATDRTAVYQDIPSTGLRVFDRESACGEPACAEHVEASNRGQGTPSTQLRVFDRVSGIR